MGSRRGRPRLGAGASQRSGSRSSRRKTRAALSSTVAPARRNSLTPPSFRGAEARARNPRLAAALVRGFRALRLRSLGMTMTRIDGPHARHRAGRLERGGQDDAPRQAHPRARRGAASRSRPLKHAHHAFDDRRARQGLVRAPRAGASEVLVASGRRWALVHELRGEEEPALADLLRRLSPVDLVIVEGFKADAPSRRSRCIGRRTASRSCSARCRMWSPIAADCAVPGKRWFRSCLSMILPPSPSRLCPFASRSGDVHGRPRWRLRRRG